MVMIGIYTPFPANIGGGERYIMTLASALQEDYEVEFLSSNSDAYCMLGQILDIDLSKITFRDFSVKSIFNYQHYLNKTEYDIFICMCNSTTPPILGKGGKNILHIQFPYRVEYLQSIQKSLISKIKALTKSTFKSIIQYQSLANESYTFSIVNSEFTKLHLEQQFSGAIEVINPPVNLENLEYVPFKSKKNQILSVGRFVGDQDSKCQLEMIRWFKELIDTYPQLDLRYYCLGGVSSTTPHRDYFQQVKDEARGYPIYVLSNIKLKELRKFYSDSKIFWHAKGYQVERLYPEFCEHFGISTVEAMYSGCVPVTYKAGGQEEIIRDGHNGFLWKTKEILFQRTIEIISGADNLETISNNAHKSAFNYSKNIFEEKVRNLIKKFL
ncbi:MAG: glycosyltransferase family 4 protein [Aphanocapsa sp. GSE-SYN-MK-11-07L]|jgi:glycosyltransferase involved in cell wall biosynthesis|nr:glycosyltransferase family 4 protein [Aphanocapsa sp. GSE-SYN-MK-11-07L]